MKSTLNFFVQKQGQEYTLICCTQGYFFIPNSWGLVQEEVSILPKLWKRYTPFHNSVGFHKSYGEVPSTGYSFELGDKHIEYKGQKYPVAISYKKEVNVAVKPLLRLPINEFMGRDTAWELPGFLETEKLFSSNPAVQVADKSVLAYTEESAVELQEGYNYVVATLKRELELWKASQEFNVGDTVYGISIEDIEKCPNETALYHFEGGGEIHNSDMWKYEECKEKPVGVEQVNIDTFGNITFLHEGEWFDDLEDIEPEVNF